MAAQGNMVNWKEHLGRRLEVLRAAHSNYVSAIDDVIDILNKLPNGVASAESCNKEAPAPGERRINLQLSSDWEETVVGIGLGTQALGGEDSNNGSAEHSVEDNNAFAAAAVMEKEHSTAHDPPQGKKNPKACGSLERETNEQEQEGLLPADDGFTMTQMGENDDSQAVEDIMLFDSRDEKMIDLGSQSSDEKMNQYCGLDRFGLEDMGDADSDTIYSEGFPSLDEMEDDFCDEFDAMSEPDYFDEDTGEEDEESEQHHGFDDNTGGDADACEQQPQQMEVDDGNTAFKEIDEAFLCPEDRERILKLGLGTHVRSKKPSSVSWYDFPGLPHTNSYSTFSNIDPIEVVHVSDETAAEFDTHEENFTGSDFSTLFGLLDDKVEVQFERGIVRHWACVDFSSLSYKKSLRLIDLVADAGAAIGMKFYSFPQMLARVKPASWDDIVKTLLDMIKKIIDFSTKLKEEDSEVFLLVILPHDQQYDDKIKELCGILKVAYEVCYPAFVDDIFKWELKETARKIQSKVVKRDVRRRRLALPLVSEAPMIIFGADLFHCMLGEASESIATVAASLDWPKFRKYFVKESSQPYGEGIIKDLHNSNGGIMIDFFNSFYKRINQNPQRIIFFRNGLERVDFGSICQQEIDAIKQACALFNDRHQPQLTYVVVLPTPFNMIETTDKSNDNIPGTDEADPTKFKFWCCHRGQKNNTFSLVCYYVVHDDNNFPARQLQSLTLKLCTFRHRWTSPEIDTVPPAYYAQSAALHAVQEWIRKTTSEVTLPRDNK